MSREHAYFNLNV